MDEHVAASGKVSADEMTGSRASAPDRSERPAKQENARGTAEGRLPGCSEPESVIGIVREYAGMLHAYLPAAWVYLFGSQAKGTATERSDIDVGILVERMPWDISWKDYCRLQSQLTLDAFAVDDRIEHHLKSYLDDTSGFSGHIVDTGILVSEPVDPTVMLNMSAVAYRYDDQ